MPFNYINSFLKKWWVHLLAIPLVPVKAAGIFVLLVYFGAFGHVPDRNELSEIRQHEASVIYSSDEQVLGRYYLQNREMTSLDYISSDFPDALLAIEDIRFYEHNGLDRRAMARVFVRSLILQQDAGGGSTITQQLAKNLYPRQGYSWFYMAVDKLREIFIAWRLENIYSKQEILELYINTVSFGEDTWGITTASERFFNAPPDELELHQAATLAGMLRATTLYNPRRNPDNALQRRNLVIRQMEIYGMIESETAEDAIDQPLDLDYNRHTHGEGEAPHYREYLRGELNHILSSTPALDGEQYNLYTDGLKIKTTLDSRIQKAAEDAVESHLSLLQQDFDRRRNHEPVFEEDDPVVKRAWRNSDRYRRMVDQGASEEEIENALDQPATMDVFTWDGPQTRELSPRDSIRHYLSFLNAGFLAMDPGNGDVLAWVGGISDRRFQYDHVRARRQTGSAFKPVVYAAALETGMSPCEYQRNLLSRYDAYDNWTPQNLQKEYGGHYSLQAALSQSVNTIAVDLLMQIGVDKVRNRASLMGIESHIPREPSIALGTAELSLLEMTRAYTAFANRGHPATQRHIKAIYNADGELIYDFTRTGKSVKGSMELIPESKSAFSEETAAAMVEMLSKTMQDGTGSSVISRFNIEHALAGKTGTAQHFTDGWFIGMTPDMVFGSWIGGVTPRVQLPRETGFASQTALPVAGYFLQNIGNNDELSPIPATFHDYQTSHNYYTGCEDYRDRRFTDRVRDFFTGTDVSEAQIVEDDDDEEDNSLLDRVRGWFSRN